jgi:hypothetical protein
MDVQKILVIGYSTRYIVCSGRRAGYEIYSIDHFCDMDLQKSAKTVLRLPMSIDRINACIKGWGIDATILASGFERIKVDGVVLNNDMRTMEKVTNKLWLAERLEELGIPHPRTYTEDEYEIRYPLVAKPIFGGGGEGSFLVKTQRDLPEDDSFLLQAFIVGKPASVSLISTKEEALAVAVNEQLIGERWLGQRNRFGYCGNITPFLTTQDRKMCKIAEDLVLDLGLIGSNGVDFVLTPDGPVVMEVNPRFQGSLDTIELSTGYNVFHAHMMAFEDDLIVPESPKRFGVKAIVFADEDLLMKRKLDREGIADIPQTGRRIQRGNPIATAFGASIGRNDAIRVVMENVRYIRSCLA